MVLYQRRRGDAGSGTRPWQGWTCHQLPLLNKCKMIVICTMYILNFSNNLFVDLTCILFQRMLLLPRLPLRESLNNQHYNAAQTYSACCCQRLTFPLLQRKWKFCCALVLHICPGNFRKFLIFLISHDVTSLYYLGSNQLPLLLATAIETGG